MRNALPLICECRGLCGWFQNDLRLEVSNLTPQVAPLGGVTSFLVEEVNKSVRFVVYVERAHSNRRMVRRDQRE